MTPLTTVMILSGIDFPFTKPNRLLQLHVESDKTPNPGASQLSQATAHPKNDAALLMKVSVGLPKLERIEIPSGA